MPREGSAARSSLITIVIVTSLAALACGDSNPASPTDATTATTTTTTTTFVYAEGHRCGARERRRRRRHGRHDHGRALHVRATVKIGGTSATSVSYKDESTLVVTTPAGTAGAADIVVTVGYLSGTLAGGFTYLAPVDAALTFTVYNHTAGRLGSWTATLQSGATVSLAVGSLGEVVDADGNTVQAAIPVDSADAQRLVVRKAAADGLVGDLVAASTSGTVTFQVPIVSRAAYDVFVMNAKNGTDYSVVDSGALGFARNLAIARGADLGGATGPDGAIDSMVRALSEAVTLPWMAYGRVSRVAADGQIVVVYTQPNAGACATYTRSTGMLYINPERCAAVPVDVSGVVLENGIELVAGVRDIGGADSSGLLDWGSLRLTPTGRDLLAYVFLKDSKGW